MKDIDMLVVLVELSSPGDFTAKEMDFLGSVGILLEKEKTLSVAQHQYLQSIYDKMIARKYGLEPMGTDKEYAAERAMRKARDSRRGK